MRKIIIATTASFSILALPAIAMAAGGLTTIETSVGVLGKILSLLIPIAAGVAVLFFFWGLAKYILNAGDEEKKKEGRSIMIWGIIALFVMISVWGIVKIIADTLGIDSTQELGVPTITLPKVN